MVAPPGLPRVRRLVPRLDEMPDAIFPGAPGPRQTPNFPGTGAARTPPRPLTPLEFHQPLAPVQPLLPAARGATTKPPPASLRSTPGFAAVNRSDSLG